MKPRNLHRKLERSGLLGGSLRAEVRGEWPPWARRHFAQCRKCKSYLMIDQVIAVEEYVRAHPEPPPMPPMAEFIERSKRLRTPPFAALVPPVRVRSRARFRDREAQSLELRREGGGVRAFDPFARHLLVFTVMSDGSIDCVLDRWNAAIGVVGFHYWPEGEEVTIIAMSCVDRMDTELLLLWLSTYGTAAPERLRKDAGGTSVRTASLHLPPALRPNRLRLIPGALPERGAEVKSLLAMGVERAGKDDPRASAAFYKSALEIARENNDVSGHVRAAIGYAVGLDDLGYQDDALRVVADVAATVEVDREHARRLATAMINRCRVVGDVDEAERWLAEAKAFSEPDEAQMVFARFLLDFDHAEFATVVEFARSSFLDRLQTGQAALGWALASVAAFSLGDSAGGDAFLRRCPELNHRELLGWRALACWTRDRAKDPNRVDDELVHTLRRTLTGAGARTVWVVRAVEVAIERLVQVGSRAAAWLLGRLLFLDDAEASDPTVRFAGVVSGPSHSWVIGPDSASLRRVGLGIAGVVNLAIRDRESAQFGGTHGSGDGVDVLLGDLGSGPLAFGATHGLNDLPVVALGARRAASVRCIPPGTRYRAESGFGMGIASIADPFGDLSGANAEVPEEKCLIWRRGIQATLAALAEARDVGLLHLGVHGGRRAGVPQLLLADGPLTPPEVEAMSFRSRPVVLLSGCATAAREQGRGVEQSFAAAFRRAGASAIICTRWAVGDDAMAEFSGALIARWPFSDALRAVSDVCRELAAKHRPPEVWGGIVVY